MSRDQAIWLMGIGPTTLLIAWVIAKNTRVTKADYVPAGVVCSILGMMWPVTLPMGALILGCMAVFKRVA